MTCPACRTIVPSHMIHCRVCLNQRANKALRQFQRDPVRMILTGKDDLVVRAIAGTRHVQMFGAERTFCGEAVFPAHRRSRVSWDQYQSDAVICRVCRATLDEIAQEVAA